MSADQYLERGAAISECGKYRYRLWRKWADVELLPVLWLMLNPSTADGMKDDPTIRRCREFSRTWGYGSMLVGNVFALRATDPDQLARADDPVGPLNYKSLTAMAQRSAFVICAWGSHPKVTGSFSREALTAAWCPGGAWSLGLTKAGNPRHPLYLPANSQRQEFKSWQIAA